MLPVAGWLATVAIDLTQQVSGSFKLNQFVERVRQGDQTAIPELAKDAFCTAQIEEIVRTLDTKHDVRLADSRFMEDIPTGSVHLVITSPPYWNLKDYPDHPQQLGLIDEFDRFIGEVGKVWNQVLRILVPGGRMVVVVGDVNVSRRQLGRHVVFPLHSSIQEGCRNLGFDNLAPIIWHKIANAGYESETGSRLLGKPYEPNSIIKNDIEYILFPRKPGGYRSPEAIDRILSVIPEVNHHEWFQQIWTMNGASTRMHPAPFPLSLAERLVRMFSFVGDTILGPFMGTGTTNLAALRWGRNSIGLDIEPTYVNRASLRLRSGKERQIALDRLQ